MRKRKFRSIIQEIIIFPLGVMAAIVFITIALGIMNYQNMEEMMIDSNLNSLKISLSQIDNLLAQVDQDFIRYVTEEEAYQRMKDYDENTPAEEYLRYESGTMNWLSNLANSYGDIDGTFAYYENMDLLLFRGNSNNTRVDVHRYISKQLNQNEIKLNHISIHKISGHYFLLYAKKYGTFTAGCWIPVTNLMKQLGLENGALLGDVYIIDSDNNNTMIEEKLNTSIRKSQMEKKQINVEGKHYSNYTVSSVTKDFKLGMIMPTSNILRNMPGVIKGFLIAAILCIFLVPRTIFWIQLRVAKPLKELFDAMKIISDGDRDYRIPIVEVGTPDEFYKIKERFNQMMDELTELEVNLYQTKIKEQKTQLKYISQQIRPHFILNALNLIYTYDVSEFDHAKKMVLYLTKYFRYIVNLEVDFVELEKDFRHVETYLAIQKERYLDRIGYFVEWENQIKEFSIPPLIVQTFVENCIKYAIKNDGKMTVFVLAQEKEDKVKITIADTGNGFQEETLEKIQEYIDTRIYREDLGVGIQNAIERMDILYQEKVDIQIGNAATGGATIEIFLPMHM
jgi:sensor histidine kinase YesM